MKYQNKFVLTFLIIGAFLSSCNQRARKGTALSAADKEYIKGLKLLDEGETIILFDGQSDLKTSGNFFTDKRIASYWIDKRDSTKSSADFGLYSDIDTILTKDLSRSLTYASYLEVVLKDGKTFRVHVDGDRTEVKTFFEQVTNAWRANNKH